MMQIATLVPAGFLAELPSITNAPAWFLAPIGAVVALIAALLFFKSVMSNTEGDDEMIRIAKAVRDGASAYLGRQNRIVTGVFVGLLIVLALMAAAGIQAFWTVGGVAVAGLLSGLCGFFGMKTATNASARTTAAAKQSLNSGLTVAFRAGAVMGLCVTGFALIDISIWFFLLYVVFGSNFEAGLVDITTITLSFAMGASLQALFARVGGGIYTKAADVGADLVGKVEAGIPEDDARNPATIADNVGDNVGDVAGMGADLYESYYGSVLAAMALAAAASIQLFAPGSEDAGLNGLKLVTLAPALAGLGILASIVSIFFVRTKEGASLAELLKSLHMGVWMSSAIIVVGSAGLLWFTLGTVPGVSWVGLWIAIIAGLLSGLVIAWGTERYTSYEHAPTQRISEQAQMGPATVIISGIAEGMKSTWIPLVTVVVAILVAFVSAGGTDTFLMGVFGVGIAAVGMLSTLGITLATDAYGPIADNAGGNAEMTHQEPIVRERTDMLDSLGNTTAATGKGFAIGSAALTALALLAAYVITVKTNLGMVSTAPEDLKTAAAVYVDHGVFAVNGEPSAETPVPVGALLLAPRDRGTIEAGFASGEWKISDAKSLGNNLYIMEDGKDSYPFEIVPAGTATIPQLLSYYDVTLMNPKVLAGLFLGVMLVFVFCAMTMNAVGRAAFAMIDECRRQFAIMKKGFKAQGISDEDIADPLKWPYRIEVDGEEFPDYASCVAISTAGAQKEMVVPSLMAVAVPILVGLVLGVAGVMGLLAGTLVCGFAVAIFMANAGGAWDNAKKYIETGQFGGKGSDSHKAGVVGDTVGDPFKDTSGPALNILIKLVSVVSVVFAGLIVKVGPYISDIFGL